MVTNVRRAIMPLLLGLLTPENKGITTLCTIVDYLQVNLLSFQDWEVSGKIVLNTKA